MGCEGCKECVTRIKRVEELLTDLIKFVGRTNVKTLTGAEQLQSFHGLLEKAETELGQVKFQNRHIEERLAALEHAYLRKKLNQRMFLAEGRMHYSEFAASCETFE
ncbi:hypothetical protein JOC77_000121 [Peribacillus deserti]|uniref:Uncharacterized protein n=1 Tax=Peribacillus deserti TaxID=673318 RepID=A0ABS2QC53_9BACI|nr:hypothetical protein [Peribacillus deserti]MBM7690718.1 hypothetical protein [Peribacillus deserti]